MMADKLNFANPADDCLCFSLHECLDGVTSARGAGLLGAAARRGRDTVCARTWQLVVRWTRRGRPWQLWGGMGLWYYDV